MDIDEEHGGASGRGHSNQACVIAVIGATGSGKSYWLKSFLRATPQPRLMIWDAMREFSEFGLVCVTPQQLLTAAQLAGKRGALRVVYQPDKSTQEKIDKQFSFFCGIALALGSCGVVVEELSQLTKPGFSPPRWRDLITQGRHYGLSVIGTSQRPALVDKTFFSNATMIRCGKLGSGSDKKVMADAMDIPVDRIRALRRMQWLVRGDGDGERVSRDDIVIAGARRVSGSAHTRAGSAGGGAAGAQLPANDRARKKAIPKARPRSRRSP